MFAAARVIEPELLDEAPDQDAVASLDDLVRINRYLGGYATLRSMMRRLATPGERFSFLDVGAASGDMGAKIRSWYPHARITSIDYKPGHLALAEGAKVIGNAFALPFQARTFDYVFSSLFLHHFEDDAVVALLKGFSRVAKRAVLAIDLERGPLGYHFVPATKWLFGWDPITLHDAPASVQAAFKIDELSALAYRAGLIKVSVRTHRPWARLSLVGLVPD